MPGSGVKRQRTAYLRRALLPVWLAFSRRRPPPLVHRQDPLPVRRRSSPAASRCRALTLRTTGRGRDGEGGLPACRDDDAHSRAEHTTRTPTRNRSRSLRWRLITSASCVALRVEWSREVSVEFGLGRRVRFECQSMIGYVRSNRTFQFLFPFQRMKKK